MKIQKGVNVAYMICPEDMQCIFQVYMDPHMEVS